MTRVRTIWGTIRYHGAILLPALVLGGLAGFVVTQLSETTYTARADLFVSAVNDGTVAEAADAAAYSRQQAINFAELATRQVVLLPVIDELGLESTSSDLRGQVSAAVPFDTSIISVSATDSSAQDAADLANAVASNLIEAAEEVSPVTSSDGPALTLQTVEVANQPSSPTSPRPTLNIVIGMLVGLFVGVGVIAMRDALVPPHQADRSTRRSRSATHVD